MKIEHQIVTRSERFKLWTMALIIGLIAGSIAVLFTEFVSVGSAVLKSVIIHFRLSIFVLPLIVYSVHFITNHYFLKGDLNFGVQALEHELVEIDRLVMHPQKVFLKLFNTSLALISGFAVGQFGPMLYLGGAIGSNVGYYFKLHKEHIRMLIGCSVAAAIAATFQMPLFAAVFAIEVIYAKRYFDYMLPLLISSLSAYGLYHFVFSDHHFFNMNALNPLNHLSYNNWIFLVVLALGLGLLSGIYVLSLRLAGNRLSQLSGMTKTFVFSGLALVMGALYYFFPVVHYFNMSDLIAIINGDNALLLLILMLLLRLLLTSFQLGSGIYGGNFSPGLILGITLGLLLFTTMPLSLIQNIDIMVVVTFSVVGMLSGFAHAPISAVILAVESSGQASILLPALIIAMISHLISDLIAEESVFNLK